MPEHLSSILDSTEPTLRTTGWGRTEGPLWHAAGSVTCVDGAGSRLRRWDTSGQGERGEPGDYAASGISLPAMAGFTRMAGLLRI
jgi:sugar lactone lactonase YvrE